MKVLRYWTRAVKMAWTNTLPILGWGSLQGFLVLLLITFLAFYLFRRAQSQETVFIQLDWVIGYVSAIVLVGAAVFLFNLFRAPAQIDDEHITEITRLNAQVSALQEQLEAARPRIELDQIRDAQLFSQSTPIYHLIQVWFKNQPKVPNEHAIARQVTAVVQVLNQDSTQLFTFHGQWAVSTAPDHVGFTSTQTTIDILPNDVYAKLNVAVKYPAESSAYAYCLENVMASPDGRHPPYELQPGRYHMRVRLKGVEVAKEFSFELENPGANSPARLTRVALT